MESNHRTFRRADGAIGVGFILPFADCDYASIAWPDNVASQHPVPHLEKNGIEDITDRMPRPAVTMETRTLESHSGDYVPSDPPAAAQVATAGEPAVQIESEQQSEGVDDKPPTETPVPSADTETSAPSTADAQVESNEAPAEVPVDPQPQAS